MSDEKPVEPVFKTAAEIHELTRDQPAPQPGMSISPGLRAVDDSPVPNADRSHVVGPQQAAADPVLAGLDTQHNPMTRAEFRVITRADGENVLPPPDLKSDAVVGPSGVSASAAEGAEAEAAKITPTADAAIATPAEKAASAKVETPKTEPTKVEPTPAAKP